MSSEYRGPEVRVNSDFSGAPTRNEIGFSGKDRTGVQKLWDAVGYPSDRQLKFGAFWTRYQRTGVGRGIIDKFASDTWQDLPDIVDDHDSSDGDTDFESDIDELFKRRGLRGSPKQWFENVDRMAQLGQYAILLLGFDDDEDLSEPVEDGSLNGLEDLNFIVPYDEGRIDGFEREEDVTHERFGLPTTYQIQVSEEQVETVHYSRVIHVPEGVVDDPLKGTEFHKPIFHELINIDKILAASGEGFWRGAYQGIVAKPPTGPDGNRIDVSKLQDSAELQRKIDDYLNNFERMIATTGEIETLGSDIADPTPHLESQFRSISTYLDAPMSVLMGNETGERATQEDMKMWHERIASRRNTFAEDVILRPVIDRLIDLGVLPEPSGDTYEVDWPPLEEPTEKETAEVALIWAEVIDVLSGGMPDQISTRAERRKLVMDWKPALGSEIDEDVADLVDQPLDTTIDENDPEVIAAANAMWGDESEADD